MFFYIIPDGRDSENSILISFLDDVPKAVPDAFTQVVIRPYFILGSLASQTFSRVPFIGLNSNSKSVVRWKLFLAQISRLSQFIVFTGIEIVDVGGYKLSLRELVLTLGLKNLFDFVMNYVFFDLAEPEVSRVHFPVVISFLLLASLKISMGLQIHLPHFLRLQHIHA